jgi:peptidoglycan/LPS O-acetylase OafA/YrhL
MLGQTSGAPVRFEALDALRGICALLVVLFHIPIYHALKGAESFVNLQFCVDMFFALSGFVLCHASTTEGKACASRGCALPGFGRCTWSCSACSSPSR